MTPEDQYPSTLDCAPIVGAQDDPVLMCLENARERIQEKWTADTYIGMYAGVCALGAVFAASGITAGELNLSIGAGAATMEALDGVLRDEAKESIALLNEAALELYPEAEEWGTTQWAGPLEWINQEFAVDPEGGRDDEAVKSAVLSIYDLAIQRRAGEPALA